MIKIPKAKVIGKVPRRKKTMCYVDPDSGNVFEFTPGRPKSQHEQIGNVSTKDKHNHIYRVKKSGNVIEVPVNPHSRKGTKGVRKHTRTVHR